MGEEGFEPPLPHFENGKGDIHVRRLSPSYYSMCYYECTITSKWYKSAQKWPPECLRSAFRESKIPKFLWRSMLPDPPSPYT